jgi:hypothetical protein
MLEDAIAILSSCEAQQGAAARSKLLLADVLRRAGDSERSGKLRAEVFADLKECGHKPDDKQFDAEYMEQFVLLYHR